VGTWREIAAPIIYRVIREVGQKDEKALRKALREAYPFGEREMWPYKVWLDEIRRQTGKRKPPRKVIEAMKNQTTIPFVG